MWHFVNGRWRTAGEQTNAGCVNGSWMCNDCCLLGKRGAKREQKVCRDHEAQLGLVGGRPRHAHGRRGTVRHHKAGRCRRSRGRRGRRDWGLISKRRDELLIGSWHLLSVAPARYHAEHCYGERCSELLLLFPGG